MSSAQLQQLMAQVEQLTLVNNKLQQELSTNSTTIARLETAMHHRRGTRTKEEDADASWSQNSSARSSRSGEGGVPVPIPGAGASTLSHADAQLQSPKVNRNTKSADLTLSTMTHGATRRDYSTTTVVLSNSADTTAAAGSVQLRQHRPGNNWQGDPRDRRDSGSCDHTESELDGLVYRDVSTNTPSTHEVHFARLPGLDDAVGPGVISSDRHGNELVTIGTQTTEIVMTTDCEHEAVVENVRGCSKATVPQQLSDFYHGAWPIVDGDMGLPSSGAVHETQSVMSFHSSISSHSSRPSHHYKDSSSRDALRVANQPPSVTNQGATETHSGPIVLQPLVAGNQTLGSKVHMVYSLISMLGTHDPEDMSQTLLAMSSSPDSCVAMKQSGCLPLLVQLIYGSESDKESMAVGRVCRARACKALHNIIHTPLDDKRSRREVKLLKYLEIVQAHCQSIREDEPEDQSMTSLAESIWPPHDMDRNPGPAVAALMKLSFDDHCRQPIVALGGLECIAQLIKFDQASYSASSDLQRITMRRYACMTLTNLTFGDSTNKARLCAMQSCLDAIVHQLQSFNEDLCQVAASVIRNLSWKADKPSKRHLRLSHATTKLMITAIQVSKESTLKSILSALWNLSAHCTHNKTCICEVDGAIEFLVGMLSYQSPGKTLAIVECAGGILRNISSVIAVRDDYRKILRIHNALEILLTHLKSSSLAIVGNACGALWNISARCPEDQKALIDINAISMLKNLTASKHRLVSLGSAATIKNLMQFKNEGIKSGGNRSKHSSSGKRGTMGSTDTPLSAPDEPPQSPSKHRSSSQHESTTSSTELSSKVHRTDSQDSVGSCSSLTSREGLTTLTKIEQLMQDVIHTNMEMHQLKRVAPSSSAHSSDTRINSGSSTPRSKAMASNFTLMAKSSDYPLSTSASQHSAANVSASRQLSNSNALSPRVNHKRAGHFSSQGAGAAGAAASGSQFYPALVSSLGGPEDRFSVRSGGSSTDEAATRTNFSRTYNDDNIDNSSEKPVDYSQMYQENSVYEQQDHRRDVTAGFHGAVPRQQLEYPTNQLPAAFLHHDPSVLLQTSSGNFLDPSYFHAPIPTLEQIKAQAMSSKPRVAPSAARPPAAGTRAMSDLSRIEDHHGEDQVRTFCTEGTPMNFLSTATSMNELNKIGEDTIPEQDEPVSLPQSKVKQNLTKNRPNTTADSQTPLKKEAPPPSSTMKAPPISHPKLPDEEDEPPRTYATEDTPLTGISRVSSLSSLTSGVDGKSTFGVGVEQAGKEPLLLLPAQGGLERIHEDEVLSPALPANKPPSKTPLEQKSVSFDDHAHVQETPMMFSRASSLASLSSCDQHSIHSSVFSEYSCRRASQVVSPSDLPDSPGGTTPHSPTNGRKVRQTGPTSSSQSVSTKQNSGRETLTPPLPHSGDQQQSQTNQQTIMQSNNYHYEPQSMQPAGTGSKAISNLLGLSGMFGSLSGLISVQDPEIELPPQHGYGYQYTQPTNNMMAHPQFPANNSLQYPQQSYQMGMGDVGYGHMAPHIMSLPPHRNVVNPQLATQPLHEDYGALSHQQYASAGALSHQQYVSAGALSQSTLSGNTPPSKIGMLRSVDVTMQPSPSIAQPDTQRQVPQSVASTTQQVSQPTSQQASQQMAQQVSQQMSQQVSQQASQQASHHMSQQMSQQASQQMSQQVSQQVSRDVAYTKEQRPRDSTAGSASKTAMVNNKVDQFLTDTVRTYAVEGTPGPNSTRSSLSALTFLDEPEVPASSIALLKSSYSKSRESVSLANIPSQPPPALPAKRVERRLISTESLSSNSPCKPLDLSIKPKPESDMKTDKVTSSSVVSSAEAAAEDAPPIPPKPAHLFKKKVDSAISTDSPIPSPSGSEKFCSSSPGGATRPLPAAIPPRSSNNSESRHDSDSSSDGDDFMLQQCISSAMPISRKKMSKSSSDGAVTVTANRNVPRSKTFGSKLRMPSKKSLKAAQLAKQRQAPPIVSANSPTPDDDYFAEETVMAYCTEDTPYNKSTATSLSDLSVIDDDDDLEYSNKSDDEEMGELKAAGGGNVPPTTEQKITPGAKSSSGSSSSSSSDDEETANSMLNNAISSALPKKSLKSTVEQGHRQPQDMIHTLKYTSNELRATDIKFQTSADSFCNYATEGTPNNFSNNTSLSDLTMDSHYSSKLSQPSTTRQLISLAKPSAGQPVVGQPVAGKAAPSGAMPSSSQSQSSRQSSLLPRRQAGGLPSQSPMSSLSSRLPQASSSPVQRVSASVPSKPQSSFPQPHNHTLEAAGATIGLMNQSNTLSDQDEIRSFGVEGTPFNFSRQESLSSLSCDDDDDDDELNVTIINRVNEAMMKRLQEAKAQTSKTASPAKHSEKSPIKTDGLLPVVGNQGASVEVKDGVIKKFTLPPPSDGFQSRDEVTKSYTPIEGTPSCFSRNSPLSSLSGSSDSESEEGSASAVAMSSIAEAHQAEGGKISDSSDSDSDASQGSLASSHAFLDHCISSALPKKTSTLPRSSKSSTKQTASKSAADSGASAAPSSQVKSGNATVGTQDRVPPATLPKPLNPKPSPVSLLPSSGEMVVSQRTPSRGMSTDTSTDSLRLDSIPATHSTSTSSSLPAYKSTQI